MALFECLHLGKSIKHNSKLENNSADTIQIHTSVKKQFFFRRAHHQFFFLVQTKKIQEQKNQFSDHKRF